MYIVKMPILGFDNNKNMNISKLDKNFAILQINEETNMHLLDSIAIKNLEIDIEDNFSKALELENTSHISIYFSIVINNPVSKSLVNLTAPIIVNEDKKLLGQYIINQPMKAMFLTMDELNTL
ncbi:flagellar assembly protein FliW [Malaciobacter mytili]|uniref:flagellar assembly protein FliW n=1 Tax=Malaciobacter mytili TaxID=603050 RepID=UPI003BAF5E01